MLGAGTFLNPILRIITVVVILGAVYLFIVKPTLDTTNDAFDAFSNDFPQFDDLSTNIQDQIDDAFGSTGDSDRLRACLKQAIEAGANQQRINRCVERFGS